VSRIFGFLLRIGEPHKHFPGPPYPLHIEDGDALLDAQVPGLGWYVSMASVCCSEGVEVDRKMGPDGWVWVELWNRKTTSLGARGAGPNVVAATQNAIDKGLPT